MKTINSLGNIVGEFYQRNGIGDAKELFNKKRKFHADSNPVIESAETVIFEKSRLEKDRYRQKTNEKRGKKAKKANLRMLARMKKKALSLGIEQYRPNFIHAETYYDCQIILSDNAGKAISEFSRLAKNKIHIARTHRAALGYVPNRDEMKYSYKGDSPGAQRARIVFALSWLLLKEEKPTNRKGQFTRIVTGLTVDQLRTALRNPRSGHIPSRSAMSGERRKSHRSGDIGYLDVLKKCQVLYSRQLVWKGERPEVKGWEDYRADEYGGQRDGIHYSRNRYYLVTGHFIDAKDKDIRGQLWIDHIAGGHKWETYLCVNFHVNFEENRPIIPKKPPD